jgi:hypothetical protein
MRLNKFLDVQVAANIHSWLNGYHYPNGGLLERRDRLAMRKPGDPNPFIDNASWRQWVKIAQDGAAKSLADEKAKKRREDELTFRTSQGLLVLTSGHAVGSRRQRVVAW